VTDCNDCSAHYRSEHSYTSNTEWLSDKSRLAEYRDGSDSYQ